MSLVLRGWLGVENLVEGRNFASLHPSKLMTWTTTPFPAPARFPRVGIKHFPDGGRGLKRGQQHSVKVVLTHIPNV
jgi:hypothetical protein